MDSQDRAEGLDDDRIDGDYPPERPLGVESYGTTAEEQRWDEPLEDRLAREEPEVRAEGDDERIELVAPDMGTGPDDEPAAVASAELDDLGPLAEDDPVAGDPTTRDTVTELEGTVVPAEEAAVRVRDEDDL